MTRLEDAARAYALEKHGDQKYGDLPYEYHLRQVVELLSEHSDVVRAAAWLHDVVEDTDADLFEIRKLFGGNVARIVDICTDPPGANRKERKQGAYKKLREGTPEARAVKLADRIANMRASMENPGLAEMYRKEFPEFMRAIGEDKQNMLLILQAYKLFVDSVEALHER